MNGLDPALNFGYSTVATAPSPATSGTSLVVAAGEGANFPDPASVGAYNVVIFPIGTKPTPSNAEVVRVTAKSTDTLTITRTQESSSARTVIVGDQIAMAITKKFRDDIENIVNSGWTPASTETWTYSSADDPTYVFNVNKDVTTKYSIGMKVKCTNNSTTFYGIITAVGSYSGGNTPITVYGGTDYDLANSAITAMYFSTAKAPLGFPQDPTKWSVTGGTTGTQATPTSGTWYNIGGNVVVPIGAWRVALSHTLLVTRASTSFAQGYSTLSSANNSETITELTTYQSSDYPVNPNTMRVAVGKNTGYILVVTTKTTYYCNAQALGASSDPVKIEANNVSIIRLVCAYL